MNIIEEKGDFFVKKPNQKNFFNALFLIVVFTLTLWSVFYGTDFKQLFFYLSNADFVYVVPSIICVICFILGESVIIHYLLKTLGANICFSHCCLYSFIGFFYSCITPSASGGQPMQVVAMRKDKIPVAVSAVVLAIITITYKLVLVLIGVLVLVFRPASIMRYLDSVEWIMYLGLALNVICIGILFLLVFHAGVIRSISLWTLNLIDRIHPLHIRNTIEQKLEHLISQYNGTAEFYRSNQRIIFNVLGITFVQRCILFLITWVTYLAFHLSGESMFVITTLQGMISVAVDMLPLPGGMGISENLFLTVFQPIFGEALVLPGMLVSRGISFYTQLIICAIMTVAASFILKRKED